MNESVEETYYQKNQKGIQKRAKGYYESDAEKLREQARDKYRNLSEEQKNKKREYGRNRYHIPKEKKQELKEYQKKKKKYCQAKRNKKTWFFYRFDNKWCVFLVIHC